MQKLSSQAPTRALQLKPVIAGAPLAVALLLLGAISFCVGTYSISLDEVGKIVLAAFVGNISELATRSATVLFTIRLPRVLLAASVGAALAASGAAYQGIFRNPMVSPDILGVSNAASVGVALGLLLGLPTVLVHGLSFAFGVAAVAIVVAMAHAVTRKGGDAVLVMILSGIVMGALCQAMLSLIKYVADPDDVLPAITYWLMGSFARSGNAQNILLMAGVLVFGGGILMLLRWRLNALAFGEEEARSLGVDAKKTRPLAIAASTLMTSASVCLCGVIGWVGLIIPHLVRLVFGPDFRVLLPLSMLSGALFMLFVDDICRIAVPGELPVGVLTALVGAPLFMYLLARRHANLH